MVYLLCFDKKYKHAKHYIGFAHNEETFKKRIEHHRKGQGARLMAVIAKAGIGFHVSRTWPEGDKNFERKLKNQKKASALCPHCKTVAKAEKLRQKHIKHLAENPPSPEFQAMVDKLKDPKEFDKLFEQFGERSERDPKFEVCPVVAQAKERAEVQELVQQGNRLAQKFGVEPQEVSNDKSTSIHDSSGWSRVRSALARFWQFLTS